MEKLVLIKVGGKIVEEEETLRQLLNDFAAIEGYKVLVHGGGRSATKLAAQLGIESKMVNGRRITDAETLKVVTMVYGGLVNKNIVAGVGRKRFRIDRCGHEFDALRQTSRGRGGLWFRRRRERGECRFASLSYPSRYRAGTGSSYT